MSGAHSARRSARWPATPPVGGPNARLIRMSGPLLSDRVQHTLVLSETLLATATALDAQLHFPPASQMIRLRQGETRVEVRPPFATEWRVLGEIEVTATMRLQLMRDHRYSLDLGSVDGGLSADWVNKIAEDLGLTSPLHDGTSILPWDARFFLEKRIGQLKVLKRKALAMEATLAELPPAKKARSE